MRVRLSVGAGKLAFHKTVALRTVPRVGDRIAASGEGRLYLVGSVTITPDEIYVGCVEQFVSEVEVRDAAAEWSDASW